MVPFGLTSLVASQEALIQTTRLKFELHPIQIILALCIFFPFLCSWAADGYWGVITAPLNNYTLSSFIVIDTKFYGFVRFLFILGLIMGFMLIFLHLMRASGWEEQNHIIHIYSVINGVVGTLKLGRV
ncbi:hypothetical protein ACJX0J_007117, partial [Zea mays]